ncbi:MAG: hypothetical protein ACRD1F_08575 [Terriglobales bacterium]
MERLRRILTQTVVLAMLVPLLSFASACPSGPAMEMDAMACCRNMHSTCMHCKRAGSLACCHHLQSRPVLALTAPAPDASAPPAAMALATINTASSPVAARTPATVFTALSPPPAPATLSPSLRI